MNKLTLLLRNIVWKTFLGSATCFLDFPIFSGPFQIACFSCTEFNCINFDVVSPLFQARHLNIK